MKVLLLVAIQLFAANLPWESILAWLWSQWLAVILLTSLFWRPELTVPSEVAAHHLKTASVTLLDPLVVSHRHVRVAVACDDVTLCPVIATSVSASHRQRDITARAGRRQRGDACWCSAPLASSRFVCVSVSVTWPCSPPWPSTRGTAEPNRLMC